MGERAQAGDGAVGHARPVFGRPGLPVRGEVGMGRDACHGHPRVGRGTGTEDALVGFQESREGRIGSPLSSASAP